MLQLCMWRINHSLEIPARLLVVGKRYRDLNLSFKRLVLSKQNCYEEIESFDCMALWVGQWGFLGIIIKVYTAQKSLGTSFRGIVIFAERIKSIELTKMSKIYYSDSCWMQNKTKEVVIVVLQSRPLDPIKQSVLLPRIFLFLVSSIGPNKSKHLRISMPGEKKFN